MYKWNGVSVIIMLFTINVCADVART